MMFRFWKRQQRDADLDEELHAHLEMAVRDRMDRGETREEAERAARREFGNVGLIKEVTRDTWGFSWLERLQQDLRDSLRILRRNPAITTLAVVSLALAIGANTAIFSLLNALVLRELPVRDPGSLVQVTTSTPTQTESYLTLPMFLDLSQRQQEFSAVIGSWGSSVMTVSDNGRTVRGLVWAATGNLHEELGLRPALGRLLVAGDMTLSPPAAEPVAVLGYGFWQRNYGGDTGVVGRTIRVEGAPFTLVGVAPKGFTGFGLITEPDITIPLAAISRVSGSHGAAILTNARAVRMVGRLRNTVTIDQARAHLAALWPSVRDAALPSSFTGERRADFLSTALNVTSASKGTETSLRAEYTKPLMILLAIAALVLVIACTNISSLLLSRVSVRRHEIGVRLALGASRWRVGRQLVTEGVLLAIGGAVGGVVLSFWACARIAAIVFDEFLVPVVFDGTPDFTVTALTTAAAIAAGIVCSALPAWRGTEGPAADALRTQGRSFSAGGRAGRVLVASQIALSMVLLTAAGVLVRSLSELRSLQTGIERSDDVFVAYPAPAQPGSYEGIDNDAYYREVLGRIESLPGVSRASISLLKPGAGGGFRDAVQRAGEPPAAGGATATRSPVSPGFFQAIGIPILTGRDFDWRDNSRGPGVTILSQSLAARLFGKTNPVGQRVRVGLDPSRAGLEVIGVVADARLYDMKNADVFAAYTPALQDPNASFKCFVIRGAKVSRPEFVQIVESLGRERVGNVVTLQYITNRSLLAERFTAMASSFFGSLVLLLAGVGLLGLMSQTVAQRRKEIGIRMAVGADLRRIVWDVVGEGLSVTLAGLAVGIVAALATVRVVESLLFGVTPQDPLTLAAAAASLLIIAIVACLVPASRAARVDPLIVLRGD
jgi:putative ABC transport system permease protein